MSNHEPAVPSPKKGRSPSYPAIPLDAALERAQALHDKEGRNPAPITAIHRHWNYSPNSGPANLALAALKKFGLLVDEGSGKERRARLTELAITALRHPDSTKRKQAIQEAALKPAIHRELWEQHDGELPSDETLDWELTQERQFTATGAREFISQFKRTVEYAQLADAGTIGRQDVGAQDGGNSGDPESQPDRDGARRDAMSGNTLSIPVPIIGGTPVTVAGQFPISEAAWTQFMAVLAAMKPGLVASESSDAAE